MNDLFNIKAHERVTKYQKHSETSREAAQHIEGGAESDDRGRQQIRLADLDEVDGCGRHRGAEGFSVFHG